MNLSDFWRTFVGLIGLSSWESVLGYCGISVSHFENYGDQVLAELQLSFSVM